MATKTKMVVKTTKKKMDGGDKNEPGKNPKAQPKPKMSTRGKSTVNSTNTNKALGRATNNTGKLHPVTGKQMTKAQAVEVERQKEYKKNSK